MNVTKTITSITISPEGIDVFIQENGANGIEKLSIETEEQEREQIFLKYGIEHVTPYPFDMNVVRALAVNGVNGEQLRTYMETCRKSYYAKGKIKIPDNIPPILYDLSELKTHEWEMPKKIEMYNQAKSTKQALRGSKKFNISLNPWDKAYFEINKFLQSRNNKNVLTLASGNERKQENSFRDNVKVTDITQTVQHCVEKNNVGKEERNECK